MSAPSSSGRRRDSLPPTGALRGDSACTAPRRSSGLSFIKDLQAFNYTLAEIGNILRLAGPDLGATDADLAEHRPR